MEGFKEIEILPFVAKDELKCNGDCDLDIHTGDISLAWYWGEARQAPQGVWGSGTRVLYSHDNDLCIAAVVRKIFGRE